jgi:hypothetical protein
MRESQEDRTIPSFHDWQLDENSRLHVVFEAAARGPGMGLAVNSRTWKFTIY